MNIDDEQFRAYMGRNCACFNLRRAARLVTQRYDQVLRPSGLTANQLSILISAYNEGGRGMSKLAKVLGMERTTLTRNVAILERLEFLSIIAGRDKRERRVVITQKGVEKLRRVIPLWQKAQDEMVELVGEEKWGILLSGLHEVSLKV